MLRLKLGLRKLETERYAFARGIHLHIQYKRHKAVLENSKSVPGLKFLPKQENHAHITKSNDILQQPQPFPGIGNWRWVALFVYLNNFWPILFGG